ncbi:integrase_H2C2 domain-containing protein [Nephila pilipes]|uniref:Integrase_H2C2 domain-containing protein n=1 Tax=Nephila pilipes TaxID=299642 RepID=A0A8X6TYH8_NEPPI|nr:integrase_H2C2 domain-containing protein [Nephila pilipes]
MFKTAKGFIKEDLLFVAEEIGEILPEKVKMSELKDIILKIKAYVDDPEFVTSILVTTEGPSWLYLSPNGWPSNEAVVDVNDEEVNKERKRTVVSCMVNIQTADIMSDYFSTYSMNVRVVAWILRFIHNISNVNKLRENIVYEEYKKAENLVFKSMQLRSFQDENFLAKMQAFKDEEGFLRIRTKLVDSDEKEDFKFPVLLPANDVVMKLIREEHKKAMHAVLIYYLLTHIT